MNDPELAQELNTLILSADFHILTKDWLQAYKATVRALVFVSGCYSCGAMSDQMGNELMETLSRQVVATRTRFLCPDLEG